MLTIFPSQAGMSLTKLYLAGNNLIFPRQGEFGYSDCLAEDGKIANLFFTVNINNKICLGQEQYLPVSIKNTGLQNLHSGKYLAFIIHSTWLPYPAQ
jgi:hypothetical protein